MDGPKTLTKLVAFFEAAKGVLILLVGFGALSLVHRNIRLVAAGVVGRFHLNPTHLFARSFIEISNHMNDARLWLYASLGFLYASFRFLEAYGLWLERSWAEWLAVISGGIFLPFEIYELASKFTLIRMSAFVVNLIVVYAVAAVLFKKNRLKGK